ncbi:MAG TPA: hypothetical protein PKC98_21220, partial [Candidatus Melainabacteria bacterium]|nr:hypothetical protein [Candidatus Melainabacteria bacterium]
MVEATLRADAIAALLTLCWGDFGFSPSTLGAAALAMPMESEISSTSAGSESFIDSVCGISLEVGT